MLETKSIPTLLQVMDKFEEIGDTDFNKTADFYGLPVSVIHRVMLNKPVDAEDRFLIYNCYNRATMKKDVIRHIFGYTFDEINLALGDEVLLRLNPSYKHYVDMDEKTIRTIVKNCLKSGYTFERIKELSGLSNKQIYLYTEGNDAN